MHSPLKFGSKLTYSYIAIRASKALPNNAQRQVAQSKRTNAPMKMY